KGLALLAGVLGVGCDGFTTASFHVVSASGTPLAEATARISNAPNPTSCTTDAAGSCGLRFLHGGWYNRYEGRFSKVGFQEVEARTWAGSRLECSATLSAVAESQASLARCR